jgi:hypothetical protein
MHYHYHKLLIMLCLNLLIFNIFYIPFASSGPPLSASYLPLASCETIGIFLHFFLLVTFFLMSSMSVLRYLMLIKVFSNYPRFNLISILISYGLSAVIVIVTIVTPPGPQKYASSANHL